jgi:hypothetical protein
LSQYCNGCVFDNLGKISLLQHCYTIVTLLSHYWDTVVTLSSHCCYTVATQLLHCHYAVPGVSWMLWGKSRCYNMFTSLIQSSSSYTIVTLSTHRWYTVVTLSTHRWDTVVTLSSHSCYTVVTLYRVCLGCFGEDLVVNREIQDKVTQCLRAYVCVCVCV